MKEAVAYYAELAKNTPPGPQGWRARDYYLQGKMAMFFYSSYIMDDLAIEENAKDSLTGDNFADLEGKNFDPELVTNTRLASTITNTQGAGYGTIVSLAIPKHGDAAKAAAAEKFIRYLLPPTPTSPGFTWPPGV